jgi:hypothetical protein
MPAREEEVSLLSFSSWKDVIKGSQYSSSDIINLIFIICFEAHAHEIAAQSKCRQKISIISLQQSDSLLLLHAEAFGMQ